MNTPSFSRLVARLAPGLAGTVATATAAQLTATIEIPQLDAAEYHRPYVALWIESADKSVTNIAVWYKVDMAKDEGETWLKDIRQWWRKSGRELELPIDGLSGPTRPVGKHEVKIPAAVTAKLVEGEYEFVVEASREVGNRELIRLPFKIAKDGKVDVSAKGKLELGTITLRQTD